jgi:pilus assembly protein CpaE
MRDAVLRATPDLIILDMEAVTEGGEELIAVTRALTDHDPDRHVIAIGDEDDSQAVLMGMRAGARDFLDRNIGDQEMRARVAIYRDRTRRRSDAAAGRLVLLAAGQPGDCHGSLAVNYALMRARAGADTLLIDLAPSGSEASALLDIDIPYSLRNVLSDQARLDRTLLSSALARHEASGLHVLPMPAATEDQAEITPDEIMNIVHTLRGLFGEIVLNICNLASPGLFHDLLREANLVHLVALQKITSVKSCRDMLNLADPAGQLRDHVTLVVDGYDDAIKLTDRQIQQTLGLKQSRRLPEARTALLNALNAGVPLVLAQPRAPYTKALRLLAVPPQKKPAGKPARQGLFGLFGPVATNA